MGLWGVQFSQNVVPSLVGWVSKASGPVQNPSLAYGGRSFQASSWATSDCEPATWFLMSIVMYAVPRTPNSPELELPNSAVPRTLSELWCRRPACPMLQARRLCHRRDAYATGGTSQASTSSSASPPTTASAGTAAVVGEESHSVYSAAGGNRPGIGQNATTVIAGSGSSAGRHADPFKHTGRKTRAISSTVVLNAMRQVVQSCHGVGAMLSNLLESWCAAGGFGSHRFRGLGLQIRWDLSPATACG